MILIRNSIVISAGQCSVFIADLDDEIIAFPACGIVVFSTVNARDTGVYDRTASIVPSHFIFKRNPAVNTMVFGFKIHRKFFRNLVCVLWGNPEGNVVFFYVIRILRSLRLRRNQAEEQDKKATTQKDMF